MSAEHDMYVELDALRKRAERAEAALAGARKDALEDLTQVYGLINEGAYDDAVDYIHSCAENYSPDRALARKECK